MVASQCDDQGEEPSPGARWSRADFRRRGGTEDLSVSDSARLRLPAQVNVGNLAEVHRPDFINRSPRHQLGDLRVKHAAKEKECRAPMVSRRRHNSSRSNEACAPASADHGQGQGQPEGGKKRQPKQTPPPGQQ